MWCVGGVVKNYTRGKTSRVRVLSCTEYFLRYAWPLVPVISPGTKGFGSFVPASLSRFQNRDERGIWNRDKSLFLLFNKPSTDCKYLITCHIIFLKGWWLVKYRCYVLSLVLGLCSRFSLLFTSSWFNAYKQMVHNFNMLVFYLSLRFTIALWRQWYLFHYMSLVV